MTRDVVVVLRRGSFEAAVVEVEVGADLLVVVVSGPRVEVVGQEAVEASVGARFRAALGELGPGQDLYRAGGA